MTFRGRRGDDFNFEARTKSTPPKKNAELRRAELMKERRDARIARIRATKPAGDEQ